MKKYSISQKERLHYKRNFLNVIRNGNLIKNDYIKLYYITNSLNFSRFGIIVNKKFGKAVERNKYKRIIRELYRYYKNYLNGCYDLVFFINEKLRNLNFKECRDIFLNLLKSANILVIDNEKDFENNRERY